MISQRVRLGLILEGVGLGFCILLMMGCSRTPKDDSTQNVAAKKTPEVVAVAQIPESAVKQIVPAFPPMSVRPERISDPAETHEPELCLTTIKPVGAREKEEAEKPAAIEKKPAADAADEAPAKVKPVAATPVPVPVHEPVKKPESLEKKDAARSQDSLKETYVLEKGSRVAFTMIRIPAGHFLMGSEVTPEAKPVEVTLTQDFLIGETEVTQELYAAVTGGNPSRYVSLQRPVECVSWEEATAFCAKLNESLAGSLPSGWTFTLPTEAQWEYAAKAGQAGAYGGSETIDETGWYDANAHEWPQGQPATKKKHYATHDVAKKKPNAWGLYDMNGNVWEWCRDWYAKDFNAARQPGPLVDPVGPEKGSYRVRRGGSWWDNALFSRNDYRSWFAPKFKRDHVGFRLALIRTGGQTH